MGSSHVRAGFLIATFLLSACALGASPPDASTPAASSVIPSAVDAGVTLPTAVDAGAATPTPGRTERVTITFGSDRSDRERTRYEPLIAAFEQANSDIHVQLVDIEPLLSSDDLTDPERIVLSSVDTTDFPIRPKAIMQGWVRDLTPLMDADATFDRADFYPGALESVGRNGGTYMVPHQWLIPLLFYNKDLWSARGLPAPKPDWTWTDLRAAAEHLATKRGDEIDVYGLLDWEARSAWVGELTTAGVNLDPAAEVRLDDPAVVHAFERVADLVKSGAIYARYGPPRPGTEGDFAALVQHFIDLIGHQQIGMWSPRLCCLRPLPASLPFTIGIAPFPSPVFRYFADTQGYSMSSGTQHPEAAWRWIAFLSHQAALAPEGNPGGTSAIPARKSIAERTGYWRKLTPENAAAFNAVLASPAARQLGTHTAALFDSELNLDLINRVLEAGIQGEQTISAGLAEAQRLLEQRPAERASNAPPPAQLFVASPVPEAAPSAARITFGVPTFAIDRIRGPVTIFNQNHPEIFVTINEIGTGTAQFSDLVARNDCFMTYQPPPQAELTTTLDLQPLIDPDASFDLADYPARLLTPFRTETGLHGLPDTVFVRVLHYNKDAFDAAGLAYPTATWTIDDLLHAAQQLTRGAGNSKQYGFAATAVQTRDVFFFLDRLGAATTVNRGEVQQPNFTDPKVVRAIQTYLELLRIASPHKRLQGYIRGAFSNDAYDLITQGRVGMWFDFGTNFIDLNPGEQPSFGWAIAPPPLGDSSVTANDFLVRGLYISPQTSQRDACWTWLKALSADLGWLADGIPARTTVAGSEAFVSHAPLGYIEVYRAYRAALERTPRDSHPRLSAQPLIDYYWFFRAIDRALQGNELERELADAQTLTERFLACVRGGADGRICAKQVDPDYQGRQNAPVESR